MVTPIIPSTTDPRPWTAIGFGDIRFRRIFRNTSNGSLPEWQTRPRLVTFPLAGGGVERQLIGYDPAQLTLRVEVETARIARALQLLVGTSASLVLTDEFDALGTGTYEWKYNARYLTYADVTLTACDPQERTVNGFVRCQVTFEVDEA